MEFRKRSNRVIGCAIEVHRHLGPGLLESTYEQCLAQELKLNKIRFTVQHPLPVSYKGIHLDCGYRIDFLVENEIILELKAITELKGIHEAQILTYMKLANVKQGFLINFNVQLLKDGLKSFAFWNLHDLHGEHSLDGCLKFALNPKILAYHQYYLG